MNNLTQWPDTLKATVTAAYASSLLDYLKSEGIEPTSLFRTEQIAQLEGGDGRRLIPLADWMDMLDTASFRLSQPDLPLRVGMHMTAKHLGVLGYVGMSCLNLGDAIEQLSRYSRLVGNISRAVIIEKGEIAEIIWDWGHESLPPSSMAQVQMAARWSNARRFTGLPQLAADAYFEFPAPNDISLYRSLFGGKCLFEQQQTKLVFPRKYLQLPFISGDVEIHQAIAKQAQQMLAALEDEPKFIQELRMLLLRGMTTGRLSLSDCAEELRIPARSLQRKLREHSVSFQQVLDQVRRNQAERLLSDPQNSLAEIAFLLGYTEQSSFQNAFKRWTGSSPQAWRKTEG